MSLSTSLANALSGLRVNSRLTAAASNNLANALTPGYGRQTLEVGSLSLAGEGAGVRVISANRAASPGLTAARRNADGEAALLTPQSEALSRLGSVLGEPTDIDGLFRRLETFETTLRQFAETPESQPRQIQVVNDARDLTGILNQISSEVATLRQSADFDIATDVATVNRNLYSIQELNQRIQLLSSADQNFAILVDQRERLIDEVSAIVPVQIQNNSNDVIHLYTKEGVFLLQETVSELSFTRSPIITAAMTYDPLGGGALSGLTVGGLDISPGVGRESIQAGSLAGNFAVRDQIATEFQSRLDQFAGDLIGRFQDPAVDPTLTATDPGLFTDAGAIFDPTIIEGLSGRISVNALVDPSQGGQTSLLRDGLNAVAPGPETSDAIARQLVDALTQGRPASVIPGLSGNFSSSEMVSGIVELTGIARFNADNNTASAQGTRQSLATAEAEEIGVDTDLELQQLILIEQAYSANIQIIQATSRMLQEITEIA